VGGVGSTLAIAVILGIEAEIKEKYVAFIKCKGNYSEAVFRYDYLGIADCAAVSMLIGGGPKQCVYGCIGSGSCIRACKYGAIRIDDGIAVVDPENCVACGLCVNKCPRGLIELVPKSAEARVACNSLDNGRTVRANCKVGCVSCKLCEKACEYGAVKVANQLSRIDYDKCACCGDCAAVCPMHTINALGGLEERVRELNAGKAKMHV